MTRIKRFFRKIYLNLVNINDTPQRISLGLAVGVIVGVIPGSGPIAALALAFALRLNRMAALMGSLLVNTWISIATLILAIKLGAKVFSLNWQNLYSEWVWLIKKFRWQELFETSIYKIILPIFTGYVIIALIAGVIVYIVAISILTHKKWRKELS